LVKFNHFKLNSEVETNDSIPFEDDAALFGFEKTEFRKEGWLFASSDKGLYLARGNGKFEEVKGISGKVKEV
jgi:hypothetical protein